MVAVEATIFGDRPDRTQQHLDDCVEDRNRGAERPRQKMKLVLNDQ